MQIVLIKLCIFFTLIKLFLFLSHPYSLLPVLFLEALCWLYCEPCPQNPANFVTAYWWKCRFRALLFMSSILCHPHSRTMVAKPWWCTDNCHLVFWGWAPSHHWLVTWIRWQDGSWTSATQRHSAIWPCCTTRPSSKGSRWDPWKCGPSPIAQELHLSEGKL